MAKTSGSIVTKDYLKKSLKERISLFQEWVEEKFEEQSGKIDKKFTQQKDLLAKIKNELLDYDDRLRKLKPKTSGN